uniref:Uncharacterized protein n=1 Tax=Anguilla anguilla TaxID=7936 RepID=A0A0E9T5D2_ANGAN
MKAQFKEHAFILGKSELPFQ